MKQPITIQVRDKQFRISFVNVWFTINYYDYAQKVHKVEHAGLRVQEIQMQIANNELDPVAGAEEANKLGEEIYKIGTKEFFELRMNLIEEVLTSNGYKFDKNWWERKTEPIDIINFLNTVYSYSQKGSEELNKKKVLNQRR